MIIAGCSRRKMATATPVRALELYQGGCIPALRTYINARPGLRARVWIISAAHGLVHADTPLLPYDQRMDTRRAMDIRPQVDQALRLACQRDGTPGQVLVLAEPVYLLALAGLSGIPGGCQVHLILAPAAGWPGAAAILDTWSML
ncbi:MAG: DUF6884 domain-containing protein [Streptosporangiaceae bacterium]